MKKVFTLFAAALIGLAAYAQCPSRLYFEPAEAEQNAENVMFYLKLVNSTDYLNGFNMEVQKPEGAEWLEDEEDGEWVGFTGYGHVILANWEPSNPNWRETKLFQKADLKCSIKEGNLVIIEILSTLDCRFFPQLTEEDDNTIARFSINFSGCEDGNLAIQSDNSPSGCTFSYTGDPTGTYNGAIQPDEPIVLDLTKADGIIKVKEDTPQPVEYDAFYVTGTFNEWSQDVANMVELVGNDEGTVYTGEVELADGAEFKVVAPTEDGLKWFGGVDENQVGYFEINDGLLNQPIELVDGSNFKVVGDGQYTINVQQPSRGLAEPLVMTVSKEATGISTISTDKGDNRIYDIQGRELKSVPEHGIYIQNGKKYVK
ncbi:MAG: hypothetical protein IKX31_10405 [Muribaculaceae bacterium]|nr:hypothetical protein [Muribaculaceae bacterium]